MRSIISRRSFLIDSSVALAIVSTGCADDTETTTTTTTTTTPSQTVSTSNTLESTGVNEGRWSMPAEEAPHDATWMCWPSNEEIWGETLPDVQATIVRLAVTIAGFESVKLLARVEQIERLRSMLGDVDAEVIEAPVDDLWARDTLPCFLLANGSNDDVPLAAGSFRFNGWGDKQLHEGDAQLAAVVADHLNIPLVESGLTGEGGGVEVDGEGTVLAARSSWVNDNRNPDLTEVEVGLRIVDLLGADRIIWVDGIAGADITDGHIDTLARFAEPRVVVVDQPAFEDPGEIWYDVSVATKATLADVGADRGGPYNFTALTQPTAPRSEGADFLSSYVNYYVCNGAVIAPSFGDVTADQLAAEQLRSLYPGREIVQIDIDPVAAGGGGIHCATQQQPSVR